MLAFFVATVTVSLSIPKVGKDSWLPNSRAKNAPVYSIQYWENYQKRAEEFNPPKIDFDIDDKGSLKNELLNLSQDTEFQNLSVPLSITECAMDESNIYFN